MASDVRPRAPPNQDVELGIRDGQHETRARGFARRRPGGAERRPAFLRVGAEPCERCAAALTRVFRVFEQYEARTFAAQRPIIMVELNEPFTPGVVARMTDRLSALSYRGYFLSHGRLQPIASFDAAKHQDATLLDFARRRLPPGREFVNNFVFMPAEKSERVLARLA